MTSLSVEQTYAQLGNFKLEDINVRVKSGEFFVILGPSGAGKTVLLDLIAGFVTPRHGKILLDEVDITHTATEKRRIGYMFQNYALFPNMSVYKNIGFGLRYTKLTDKARRIEDMMSMVGITKLRDRSPPTLSGGEQQRVALARALILEPQVVLLDEPLSALDERSRDVLREELRDVIELFDTTTIFVTHDQTEARLLADRIGVMYDGRLIQIGSIHKIFDEPRDESVASFVGMENLYEGTIVVQQEGLITVDIGNAKIQAIGTDIEGERVAVGIRPENITVALEPSLSSARNSFNGVVRQVLNLGPISKVTVDCGFMVAAYVTNISSQALNLERGREVSVSFKATGVHVMRNKRLPRSAQVATKL